MTTHLHRTTVRSVVLTSVAGASMLLGAASADAAPTPVPVGTPPVAVITVPKVVWAGIPITVSGARSTPLGGVSEWEWDVNGRSGYERQSSSTPWVSKAFTPGKHTVRLRVRGSDGLVGTASKTFTAKKPPNAVSEPAAPVDVTAEADGTTVEVTWTEPLGPQPLAYRVSNDADLDTDPIYVAATDSLTATFDDLVPDTYRIRVAAINGGGAGPGTDTTVEVLSTGASSASPSATGAATSTAVPTTTAATTTPTAGTSTASSSDDDNRDTIGLALIGAGGVVLLGAAIAGGTAAWRRRRSA